MDAAASPDLSPTSSRLPSPDIPVQPDHFYGSDAQQLPPSPDSTGKTWLDPEDDLFAARGIPVFKPTMEEFANFEEYMNKVECWGTKSGIVKVIPPKQWTDALPPLNDQLAHVKLKSPIEQHMLGRGGLFRQENVEKRRTLSVREWAELCARDDLRAPGLDDVGLHARATNGSAKTRPRRARKKVHESETAEPDVEAHIKQEDDDAPHGLDGGSTGTQALASPISTGAPASPAPTVDRQSEDGADSAHVEGLVGISDNPATHHSPALDDKMNKADVEEKPKVKGKRVGQTREAREASLAERASKDKEFLENFDTICDWLPPNTTQHDYTPEFCKELERRYWRNCGLGKPAWYGADMAGTLFTDETMSWNVAHLESALSRLLPASDKGLPGVNTPYLYFGMWRATFAWHVEDMDLFSINYIHFGAPKFWYAIPQGRATALENAMKGYFPKDGSSCPQFLRHKSFLASPNLLANSACRPNTLVQHAGEFVITYPRGYHAGFNLGFNCAESVNFALESWLELGRRAKACSCVNFSVRIDVDQLLHDRAEERAEAQKKAKKTKKASRENKRDKASSRKRKAEESATSSTAKKQKIKIAGPKESAEPSSSSLPVLKLRSPAKVTLKLPPKPKEPEPFPCCLCVSMSKEGLLRVRDPPMHRKDGVDGLGTGANNHSLWMAHEMCANVIPETWVDEIEDEVGPDGARRMEKFVFGVGLVVKDRWNLKCSACTKNRNRTHGAPIQCTKGKCPKAFHVSCAREGGASGIVFNLLKEVQKEVVVTGAPPTYAPAAAVATHADSTYALGPSEEIPFDPAADDSGIGMYGDLPLAAPSRSMLLGVPRAAETQHAPAEPPMAQTTAEPTYRIIKKVEVQVLCSQHNPEIAEAKKQAKQQKIRDELLALPPMARIKLRVSAGVFEVSLVRVVEETCSVEVLWDRGLKREFKWGSVVFGNTEGVTVGQKPAEAAPEPEPNAPQNRIVIPVHKQPRSESRTHSATPISVHSAHTPTSSASSPAPHASGSTSYNPYPASYQSRPTTYQYSSAPWKYMYPGQGVTTSYPVPNPPPAYPYAPNPYQGSGYQGPSAGYGYAQNPYQARGLQWQRPYTGPKEQGDQPPQAMPYYNPAQQYMQPPRPAGTPVPGGPPPPWAAPPPGHPSTSPPAVASAHMSQTFLPIAPAPTGQ